MESIGLPNAATGVLKDLQAKLGGTSGMNVEDLRQRMDLLVNQYNQTIETTLHTNHQYRDDFLGLCGCQMDELIDNAPWECPDLLNIEWSAVDAGNTPVPVLAGADWLLPRLKDGPLKLTASGYLPPALLVSWWEDCLRPAMPGWPHVEFLKIRKESDCGPAMDFLELYVAMELLERTRTHLKLGRKAKGYMQAERVGRYRQFYEAISYIVPWTFLERGFQMSTHPLQQDAWLFNLFILHQAKDHWIDPDNLALIWLEAFPDLEQDYSIDGKKKKDKQVLRSIKAGLPAMVGHYSFEFMPYCLGLLEMKMRTMLSWQTVVRLSSLGQALHRWKVEPIPPNSTEFPDSELASYETDLVRPVTTQTSSESLYREPSGILDADVWNSIIQEARGRHRSLHQTWGDLRRNLAELAGAPPYTWFASEWRRLESGSSPELGGTDSLRSDLVKLLKKVLKGTYPPSYEGREEFLEHWKILLRRCEAKPDDLREIGQLMLDVKMLEKRQ